MYGSRKSRNEMDMQQKAKTDNADQDTHDIILKLESRKWSLSEEHNSITKERATQQEELCTAERPFHEANPRLHG